MVSRGGRQVAAPNSRVARSTRFTLIKLQSSGRVKSSVYKRKTVYSIFFKKSWGRRRTSAGESRVAWCPRFIFMKIAVKRPRRNLTMQTLKVSIKSSLPLDTSRRQTAADELQAEKDTHKLKNPVFQSGARDFLMQRFRAAFGVIFAQQMQPHRPGQKDHRGQKQGQRNPDAAIFPQSQSARNQP